MRQAQAGVHSGAFSFFRVMIAGLFAAAALIGGTVTASANGKYAAIVVDANSGKTLFAENADASRYPASLTKMMTLYLVFEALQSGRISLDTRIPVSKNAAAEPPTKLGVKPGSSVTVQTAIYAMITRSANDIATATAEFLGGSEENFARLMTSKARSLGMRNTTFRNAHGLPNATHRSTARDMATLSIALREHFPRYYKYFSARSFTYRGSRINNHNRLLGRIEGVDGIKTGYTNASGFNLASSVSDGGRRIVAVVMGGQSARSRDNHMAQLIKKYLPKATTRDSGPLVASAGSSPVSAFASVILPKRNAPTPIDRPDVVAVAAAEAKMDIEDVIVATSEAEIVAAEEAQFGAQMEEVPVIQAYAPTPKPKLDVDPISTASTAPEGWAIQVASSPSEDEAKAFLARTSEKVGTLLASAQPYTVTFEKGGTTYYRARFGGFETKSAAWDACGVLKKKKIACYAVQQ